MPSLQQRIQTAAARLTPAERKVADAIIGDAQAVAFGTVADLAQRAGASGASVIRLSTKLDFAGFSDLQAAVRDELGRRLRPAIERIKDLEGRDPLQKGVNSAISCVTASFAGLDRDRFDAIIELLAGEHSIWVISGDASDGIARQFTTELAMLRPSVQQVSGSPVHVSRLLAGIVPDDVVVALDLPRYDRWVLDALAMARTSGAAIIAITDGPLSPVADGAAHLIAVDADGAGPFDNYVGVLAVLATLAAGVATALRQPAASRLEDIERAWTASGAFTDDDEVVSDISL